MLRKLHSQETWRNQAARPSDVRKILQCKTEENVVVKKNVTVLTFYVKEEQHGMQLQCANN